MDFSAVATDTAGGVLSVVRFILGLNISPNEKQQRISRAIKIVGENFYDQLYGATSEIFDSSSMVSSGLSDANEQAERLANRIVRNYALSRDTAAELIMGYYNSVLGRAQAEAFQNAIAMERHPTLTRQIVNETCGWCESKVGVYTNPTGEDFARHSNCDCLLKVSGYNSRNGTIKNYIKMKG